MILDAETAAFISIAEREAPMALLPQSGLVHLTDGAPQVRPVIQPEIQKWIRGRIEWVRAGLEKCPRWFRRDLQRFDPDLRLRWDSYTEHWIIERLDRTANLYRICGTWNQPLGEPLLEALRKGDMRRKTPDEHIKEVEDRAEKQRLANEHRTNEKYGEILDGMTNKQMHDFIDVSDALAHGENITFYGDDAKMLNRIYDENEKLEKQGLLPAQPDMAINPGVKLGNFTK